MKPDRNDLLHVETSALIVLVLQRFIPLWIAVAIAIVFAIGKELWDKEHGGVPSWSDIAWDMVGVAGGIIISLIS